MSAAVSILSMYASDTDDEEEGVEIEQHTTAPDGTVKQKADVKESGQPMEIDDTPREDATKREKVEKRKILPNPEELLSKKTKPNKVTRSLIPPQLISQRKNIVTESS